MVCDSVDILVDALRETSLLRAEQLNQLAEEFAPKFEDPQELAKHIVKLGWITLYQAKKLLAGRGADLILGHYVILDKLGEGGMGKVFKARQLRLSRTVALKVVRPNLLSNELALKRFQREAKAAAQLAHPNIVRLFDADQVDNRHFLAMEFVEGTDLAKLVQETGPLPLGMACSFMRQAATGLQHAHDAGLVHRDIKPSNLLVSAPNKVGKFDSGGVIKVLDMGLARAIAQDEDGASALTQDGTVIGTPDYMSPEQAKNSSTVDARSDLYSLGCSFYYLLTGQPPFPHGTTLEKLLQHQMDPAPPIKSLRADVPEHLAALIHKLLAKKPADRFQSGSELATALESWSVFDAKNKILTTSGKVPRPGPVPEAMVVPCSPVPDDINPFHFDQPEPKPKMVTPPPPVQTPQPGQGLAKKSVVSAVSPGPTFLKKKDPQAEPPRKKRRLRRMIVIASCLMFLVGGILYASGVFSSSQSGNESVAKEDSKSKESVILPEIKKLDSRTIDYYLPPDSEMVAVLNVQQLAANRFFQDHLLPKFKDLLAPVRTGLGLDPFKTCEKIIIGVPAGKSGQAVVILQVSDAVSSKFANWIASLSGVTKSNERVPGQEGTKEIYSLPGQKDNEVVFGAVLSATPGTLVFSASRERVVQALARVNKNTPVNFSDPTLRPILAKYPIKDPATLWLCAGGESQILANHTVRKGLPRDNGVSFLVATLRLRDNYTMTCEVNIDAKSKAAAEAGYEHVKNILNAIVLAKGSDPRLTRITELVQRCSQVSLNQAMRRENPHTYQWWCSISSDALPEWFAPFFN